MKRNTILWFVCGIIVIVLYGLFDPGKYTFPECPFHVITGWLCPGCGSQRAMHQMIHGHIGASFKMNPLFLPGILYAITGFVSASFFPASWPYLRHNFYGLRAGYVSLFVILVFWIGRNLI